MDTVKTEEKHVISGNYKVQNLNDENSVILPKQLDDILASSEFPQYRHRWNTNEEIASILIAFGKHKEWLETEVKIRPSSGSMLLYSRNKARYRKDGYCWKKRKDGKNIREDHMKLKVQGLECIYGSYVHSDILPTFHRRCYWLLQNPDIVLVHYLNVPYPDNTKVKIPMMPSCTLEKKEWTKEDLVDQLKPMFSTGRTDEESEQMIEETVEALVRHLIEYHENSKRIEKDRLDQKKLQDSMIHSNVHHPETREARYPKQSNLTHTTSCINQQIASFTSELQQKSNLERKNEGNSGYIVHHKASDHDMRNDLDLNSQSVNMSQVPYILSVNGHLNVPSANYVVVNGQGGVVTPSASLSNLHHAIDSVPPNVVISQGSLNSHCSSQFVHNLSSHVQTKVENSGERSPTVSVPEKCSNCNFSVQFTSQCRSGNVPNVLKDGKGNMVPHLSTVTAEDVQNVIQSHNSKEKSGEDQNGSTMDQLSGSLGSSDFDNLDLELPDIDKLCSFLGTPLDNSPSSHTTVASSTCTLNHVSCLGTQCQGHTHDITQGQGHNHDYSDGGQVHDKHLHGGHEEGQDQTMLHSGTKNKVDIVDICPEWSYTEGGSKLLVVGPWFNLTSQYTCVIAGNPVPTTCIQPGVLRCYTPAHSEGFASMEVTCDGHVISSPVHIEYKVKQTIGKYCQWFNLPEKELRMLLIDRLNYLEERLAQSHYRDGPIPSLKQAANNLVVSDDLEGKLLWYIKMFSAGTWNDLDTFPVSNKYEMTLLHLSAALGYNRLIQAVINWRCDNPSWFLDCEVDANCQDINSSTAMMWACVKGHEEAAVALFHWNSASLKIRNKQGLSPLDLAQENGHTHLYDRLLTLQQDLSYNDSLISGDCFSTAGTVENSLAFPILTKSHDVPFSNSKTTIPCTSDCDLFKSPAPVHTKNKGPLGTLHIEIPSNPTPTFNSDKENLLIRRQSDQTLRAGIKSKRKLNKRFSVDLPSHSDDNRSSRAGSCDRPIREANSEPHLPMTALDALTRGENPMLSSRAHNVSSPDSLITVLQDSRLAHLHQERMMGRMDQHDLVKMDTDDVPSSDNGSPLIDVEKLSSDEEPSDQRAMSDRQSVSTDGSEEAKQQMVTLAKQIIAAIPERIKYSPSRGDDFIDTTRERSSSYSSIPSQPSPHASSYGEDSGISTPMGDSFAFEEYRYPDINTPASSMSPESTCLPSPYSPYSFTLDSPPPTTAEFTEYFNAPATYMEKDFSQLTLSDQEQRRLYEAAKVIQKTYRQYRDKQQLQQQQQKEIYAAILIQKYYRRYKQYAYYKKMTQAAVLIQSQFRSYYAQKRFKKSRDAAVVIQNQYRTYKEHERLKKGGNKSVIIQQRYRSHYQRKNMKGQSSGGHVVQIVPESAESSPQDQSSIVQDTSNHQDDEAETPTGETGNQGTTTPGDEM